jgi:hypothetical protein
MLDVADNSIELIGIFVNNCVVSNRPGIQNRRDSSMKLGRVRSWRRYRYSLGRCLDIVATAAVEWVPT